MQQIQDRIFPALIIGIVAEWRIDIHPAVHARRAGPVPDMVEVAGPFAFLIQVAQAAVQDQGIHEPGPVPLDEDVGRIEGADSVDQEGIGIQLGSRTVESLGPDTVFTLGHLAGLGGLGTVSQPGRLDADIRGLGSTKAESDGGRGDFRRNDRGGTLEVLELLRGKTAGDQYGNGSKNTCQVFHIKCFVCLISTRVPDSAASYPSRSGNAAGSHRRSYRRYPGPVLSSPCHRP